MHEILVKLEDHQLPTLAVFKDHINNKFVPDTVKILSDCGIAYADIDSAIKQADLDFNKHMKNKFLSTDRFKQVCTILRNRGELSWVKKVKMKWEGKSDFILQSLLDDDLETCAKEGDIVHIAHEDESKSVWDQMLANGRASKTQYDAAQITAGVFKWPWGGEEKKHYMLLVVNDVLSAGDIENMRKPIVRGGGGGGETQI